MKASTPRPEPVVCPNCQKALTLCVCDAIKAMPSKLSILILQHPQEPDKHLGSARLAHLTLPNSTLRVGLSWPNLRKAMGREVDTQKWAVLYLGSGIKLPEAKIKNGLHFVSKGSTVVKAPTDLEGLVLLDGTWSQAKTLWWRNAWLLKLKRAVLLPARKSLYGDLRKEPRKECLSTIETIAETLDILGEDAATGTQLRTIFSKLLERQREYLKARTPPKKPAAT